MKVSLTSFLDFVMKSGSPKQTCAQQIKAKLDAAYDPAADFYKRFRAGVRKLHSDGLSRSELPKLIGTLPARKTAHYAAMIAGYQKFIGLKTLIYSPAPREIWTFSDIEIAVNPEVCLSWGGIKHNIKLYLKSDPLKKTDASVILALMKHVLPPDNSVPAVLDVRRNKLFMFEAPMLFRIPAIEGEALYLAHLLK